MAAAFDPKSDRVAAGRDFDVAIWSTRNLQQLARYQMRYPISSLAFNQAGDILIVIQKSEQDGAFVTLIEPATARFRTLPLQDCLGLVNCIAERPNVLRNEPARVQVRWPCADLVVSAAFAPQLPVRPAAHFR